MPDSEPWPSLRTVGQTQHHCPVNRPAWAPSIRSLIILSPRERHGPGARVLHEATVILRVDFAEQPAVPEQARVEAVARLCAEQGLALDGGAAGSYFLARSLVAARPGLRLLPSPFGASSGGACHGRASLACTPGLRGGHAPQRERRGGH